MKPRYRVDLPGQLAACEANYLRLMKLTPDLSACDSWRFNVGPARMDIAVIERAKYTTTMALSSEHPAEQTVPQAPGLQAPRLQVRLYHDARMAEVIAWEGHRQMRPRYDYPNRHMYHCNEKAQINQFLGEWLSYCLDQGHASEQFRTFGLVG